MPNRCVASAFIVGARVYHGCCVCNCNGGGGGGGGVADDGEPTKDGGGDGGIVFVWCSPWLQPNVTFKSSPEGDERDDSLNNANNLNVREVRDNTINGWSSVEASTCPGAELMPVVHTKWSSMCKYPATAPPNPQLKVNVAPAFGWIV